jgi:hypothetical protein
MANKRLTPEAARVLAREAFADLPARTRLVLILAMDEGLSVRETAEAAGLSLRETAYRMMDGRRAIASRVRRAAGLSPTAGTAVAGGEPGPHEQLGRHIVETIVSGALIGTDYPAGAVMVWSANAAEQIGEAAYDWITRRTAALIAQEIAQEASRQTRLSRAARRVWMALAQKLRRSAAFWRGGR